MLPKHSHVHVYRYIRFNRSIPITTRFGAVMGLRRIISLFFFTWEQTGPRYESDGHIRHRAPGSQLGGQVFRDCAGEAVDYFPGLLGFRVSFVNLYLLHVVDIIVCLTTFPKPQTLKPKP